MLLRRCFLLFSFIMTLSASMAQRNKPVAQKPAVVQKFKPPKVKTSWGGYTDSTIITVDQALNLLRLPLAITGEDKVNYGVAVYHFLYRKKGVTEDEETGKVTPTTTISSEIFKATPLPEGWITYISQQLRSGEELYFFDVVAKDTQGHIFFAPTLKIKIK